MRVGYNEIDPYCCAWLENLMSAGLIPIGKILCRDIRDIRPDELAGFDQFHFFAGLGGWPYALELAEWDEPCWTGSCPCQPFSAAGKGLGFADERHLWPAFHWLIEQRKPDIVFGEQVASPAGREWLDLVFSDLEGTDHTCGAVVFPAAGVGAPHGRHRTYWVADADHERHRRHSRNGRQTKRRSEFDVRVGGVAEPDSRKRNGVASGEGCVVDRETPGWFEGDSELERGFETRSGGDAATVGCTEGGSSSGRHNDEGNRSPNNVELGDASRERLALRPLATVERRALRIEGSALGEAEPVRGFWRDTDWIWHRDGKYRPVEPGSFPLAHGVANRVGRLRGYGNAICAPQAAAFVRAFMESRNV